MVACPVASPPAKQDGCLRLVCVSDTHLQEEKFAVPDGDVLVHSGDILLESSLRKEEHADHYFKKFSRWLESLPHEQCIVVCGNHDAKLLDFGKDYITNTLPKKATYLENETTSIAGVRIFGSPHSVGGSQNYAWQRRSAEGLWDNLPDGPCDIVISHGPAYCKGKMRYSKQPEWIDALKAREVSLHICGHLHWAFGMTHLATKSNLTTCVCVSSMDGQYLPTNQAVMIDFPLKREARVHPCLGSRRQDAVMVLNGNSDYDEIIFVLKKSLRPLFNLHVANGPDKGIAIVGALNADRRPVAAMIGFGTPATRVIPHLQAAPGGVGPLVTVLSRYFCKSSKNREEAYASGVHMVCYKDEAESDIVAFTSLAYDLITHGPASISIRHPRNVTLKHPLVNQSPHPVLAPGVRI